MPLMGELLVEWEALTSDLQQFKPIEISGCYTQAQDGAVNSCSLQGHCDAFQRAYVACCVPADGNIRHYAQPVFQEWHLLRRLPFPDWSFYQGYS